MKSKEELFLEEHGITEVIPSQSSDEGSIDFLQSEGLIPKTTSEDSIPSPIESYLTRTANEMAFNLPKNIIGGAMAGLTEVITPEVIEQNKQLKKAGFTGDIGPSNIKEVYQQYRDLVEKELKKQEQYNPTASQLGDITGLLGGASAGMSLAKKAIPSLAAPALTTAEKIISGLKTGTTGGAIYGATHSQSDLTKGEISDYGKDIAIDTLLGGAVGGSIPLTTEAISSITKQAIKSPLAQSFIDTTKGALSGKKYTTPEALEKFQKQGSELAGQLYNELDDAASQAFKAKDLAIKEASKNPSNVADLSEMISNLEQKVKDINPFKNPQTQQDKDSLLEFLNTFKNKEGKIILNPQEMNNLIKTSEQLSSEMNSPAIKNILIGDVKGTLKSTLEQENFVPNLKELNKNSHDLINLFKRFTGKEVYDLSQLSASDRDIIKTKISDMIKSNDIEDIEKLISGFEGVRGIGEYSPKTAELISKEVSPLMRDIELSGSTQKAKGSANIKKAATGGPFGMAVRLGEMVGSSAKIGKDVSNLLLGDKLSNIQASLSQIAPEEVKTASELLFNASNNEMSTIISQLEQKYPEVSQNYTNVLKSLVDKPKQSQQATLFGLMQKPQFREMIEGIQKGK